MARARRLWSSNKGDLLVQLFPAGRVGLVEPRRHRIQERQGSGPEGGCELARPPVDQARFAPVPAACNRQGKRLHGLREILQQAWRKSAADHDGFWIEEIL